jgi:hypothetical protein
LDILAGYASYVGLDGHGAVSCGGIKPGDHRHCGPCGRIRPVVTCPFCIGGRACMACLHCPDCPSPAELMELLRAVSVLRHRHDGAAN